MQVEIRELQPVYHQDIHVVNQETNVNFIESYYGTKKLETDKDVFDYIYSKVVAIELGKKADGYFIHLYQVGSLPHILTVFITSSFSSIDNELIELYDDCKAEVGSGLRVEVEYLDVNKQKQFKMTFIQKVLGYDYREAFKNSKYKLCESITDKDGRTLYRIEAVREIFLSNYTTVKPGTKGGFIEDVSCLSEYNGCWVADDARVYKGCVVRDDAIVKDKAVIRDGSLIDGMATIGGYAKVYNSDISGVCTVFNSATVHNSTLTNDVTLKDSAIVKCGSELSGNVYIEGCSLVEESVLSGFVVIKNDSVITESRIENTNGELHIDDCYLLGASIESEADFDCLQPRKDVKLTFQYKTKNIVFNGVLTDKQGALPKLRRLGLYEQCKPYLEKMDGENDNTKR